MQAVHETLLNSNNLTYNILCFTGIIRHPINSKQNNKRTNYRNFLVLILSILNIFFIYIASTRSNLLSTIFLKILAKSVFLLQIMESSSIIYILVRHETNINILLTIMTDTKVCYFYKSVNKNFIIITLFYLTRTIFSFYLNLNSLLNHNLNLTTYFSLYHISSIPLHGMKFLYVFTFDIMRKLVQHVDISLKNYSCELNETSRRINRISVLHQNLCEICRLFNRIMASLALVMFCQIFVILSEELYIIVSCYYESASTIDWRKAIAPSYCFITEALDNLFMLLLPAHFCTKTVSIFLQIKHVYKHNK